MKSLFRNHFLDLNYLEEHQILRADWNAHTADMEAEEFKACISQLWETLLTYQPKGLLADTRRFLFSIPPDTQTWYAENIPDFGKNTRKVAMLVSEGVVEQLSIEQTIDEDVQSGSLTAYFSDETEALKWLNE
jgi:nanoRNase/pAp phosphatase (c-di-AMP/oligoRNAs hydrolase)